MGQAVEVAAVVLIKDFDTAKQRLGPALSPTDRRELARRNAGLALAAANATDWVVAVCGSPEAAELALSAGATVLLEPSPAGQNVAAARGLAHVRAAGVGAALLLSSDLPLVSRRAIRRLLRRARSMGTPAVLAAPALGRGGTNALYLSPPDIIGLHFGGDSLRRFRQEAMARGVRFALHNARALALDLDEPADLEALARAV